MRIILGRLAVALGVIALSPLTAAAQGDPPINAFWYCHTQADQSPVYVTAVWDARAVPSEVYAEFRKVLAAKYNFTGRFSCPGANKAYPQSTLTRAEETRTQNLALWQKAGLKVVHIDWTSLQPKIGPAPVVWSVCAVMVAANGGTPSSGPFETYLSTAFDTGAATPQSQVEAAFKTFVITKYAIKTTDVNPQCTLYGDETGALAGVQARMKMFGARGKVIETGWKLAK